MLVITMFILFLQVKILTTINWKLEKLIEYTKRKTKRHKRKHDFVFNIGTFFRIEGSDLVNIKYLTELFKPFLSITKNTIIIEVKDYCDYNWQSREPIKEYSLNYQIFIDGILKYKFVDYFIYGYIPVWGVILQSISEEQYSDGSKNIFISMWRDCTSEVNGDDPILGFATGSSLELKSAQSLSICKNCCHYKHHPYGWLSSTDIFCSIHPASATYNLVECPSYNDQKAEPQTPLCYNCNYFNQDYNFFPKNNIGCAVHPEHKRYDLMECCDYLHILEP